MVLHRNDIPKKEHLSLRMIKAKSAAIVPFKINVSISKERYVTFSISILLIVSVRACKFWYESNYFAKLRDIFFLILPITCSESEICRNYIYDLIRRVFSKVLDQPGRSH